MKIKVLDTAKADIKAIRETLIPYGIVPANKFRYTYRNFLNCVSKMPEMFPVCKLNPNFRSAVLVYDYIAFYKTDENLNTVIIHRILHGKRNITAIIKDT